MSSNIYLKMNNVMAGCKPIIQDKAKGIQYKVTPWNKVSDMVKGLLVKEKITFIPQVRETITNGNMTIITVDGEFVNAENPEEKIKINGFTAYGVDNSDKGPGKALSYAIKYMFTKTFCMQIGDDEDSEKSNTQAQTLDKLVKLTGKKTDKVVDLHNEKKEKILSLFYNIVMNKETPLQDRLSLLAEQMRWSEKEIYSLGDVYRQDILKKYDVYRKSIQSKMGESK